MTETAQVTLMTHLFHAPELFDKLQRCGHPHTLSSDFRKIDWFELHDVRLAEVVPEESCDLVHAVDGFSRYRHSNALDVHIKSVHLCQKCPGLIEGVFSG